MRLLIHKTGRILWLEERRLLGEKPLRVYNRQVLKFCQLSRARSSNLSIMVLKDDIDLIIEVMKSRYRGGLYGYVDCETGEVLMGNQDDPLEILPGEDNDNHEGIESKLDHRYLQIPQEGARNSYQDLVDFIETVEEEQLQDLLGVAIQGRGAFERFKDVLRRSEHESERNR